MFYDPTYLLFSKIFLLLISITAVWMAFWVYLAKPKAIINRLFFLTTLSLLFWWIGGYFFAYSDNLEFSLFLGRIILGEVSISFAFVYFFITVFPYQTKRNKILEIIIVSLSIFFFFFSIFTDLIVKDTRFTEWGVDPIFGKGQIFYYGWIAFLMILIFVRIFQKYTKALKKTRVKIQYFFIGFSIFVSMNLVFNIILPLWRDSIKYWQFGNYSAIFFLVLTAYAIIKRELFGIRVILTDLLVGIMGMILFVIPFLVNTIWLKALLFVVFFFFCIIGYLLIRYTRREAKQKEILEQKVRERTKEIEKRKTDLEKFYKLLVGRELKMIELKKEIKKKEKNKNQ